MDTPDNRRSYARLPLGEGYTIQFRFNERVYHSIPISDISAGGCCAKVPPADAMDMGKGAILHTLYLIHADFPKVPLNASIVWMLGKPSEKKEGWVLVGIEFISPNPKIQAFLTEYVTRGLHDEVPEESQVEEDQG